MPYGGRSRTVLSLSSFAVSDQGRRVEQDGRLPGGLLQGLGHVLHHVPGILVEHWIVFHDLEVVEILL